MFEKLLEKSIRGIGKVLGIADDKIAALNADTVNYVSKVKEASSKISSFLLARPSTPYVQETFPEIVLGKKRVKLLNTEVAELTKKLGEQHFDILTKEEKELPLKIIEAFDKIRNMGEGINITPLKYQNQELKTFNEFKEFITNNVPKLNQKQKQVIKAFKELSDEIGTYQAINFEDDFLSIEKSLKDRIRITSSQKFLDELEGIRDFTSKNLGIDFSFWNMYYPHIQEWKLPTNKANVEFLKMLYPDKAKNLSAFWEKERKGLPAPYIEDPEIVYKTMLYNFTWLKKYREILSSTLSSHDLFRKLNPDEIQQLITHWKDTLVYPMSDKVFDAKKYLPENIYKKFKELYPNEEGFSIWHETRPFSGKVKISDDDVNNLIDILFTDDIRVKRLKEMGIEKKIYLVPETAYKEFKTWGEDIFGAKPSFNPIKDLVSLWKSSVTVWTRFVPFRLNNSIGDVFSLSMKDPGALTKLLDAFSVSFNILRNKEIKKIPLMDKSKFVELLRQHGIFQTFFDRDLAGAPIIKEDGIIGGLKYIFDLVNVSAEMTPKVASILKNLERVSKGQLPEFTGAEKYILSMVNKNKDLIPAIFERGATITVDYSNIPTQYRKIMTEFIAPFSYWYARTFDQLTSMLFQKPINGTKIASGYSRWVSFYALPLAASYYWNISNPERKAVWEALPPYLKITPLTIVAGIDNKTKKPIVLSFYTPAQMVADFLGFDNLFKGIEKYKQGLWSAQDVVTNYLSGVVLDVPTKYVSLLNPFINGVVGIVSNKDMFTKTDIVPEYLVGTKYEREIQFNYFVRQALLSPIFPAMLSIGFNAPTDFLKTIYAGNTVDKAKDFIMSYFETFFDVKGGLGIISEEKIDLFMSRAAFEKARELEASRNEIFENLFRLYVRSNIYNDEGARKQLIKEIYKIQNKEYNYLTMNDVNNYFNRSSVLRRIIKEASKLKDPETIQKINVLLNYLHQAEFVEKTAPKSIRDDLSEFLNDLYQR